MPGEIKELRCKGCNLLLGTIEGEHFEIRRGGVQIHYNGRGQVYIVCCGKGCRELNRLRMPISETGQPDTEPWMPVAGVAEKLCCKNCGVLLGEYQGDRFEVRRGGIQVCYVGRGHLVIGCYGPHCGTMNFLRLPVEPSRPKPPDGPAPPA